MRRSKQKQAPESIESLFADEGQLPLNSGEYH